MRIAVLAHVKHPIGQPFCGGLEMQTHLLVSALVRRGHAITLFCAAGSDPVLGPAEICAPSGDPTDDPRRNATIDAVELSAYHAMLDAVAAGDFDLVHNNSLHALPLARSRALGPPMVTVLHTPPFEPLLSGARTASCSFVAVSATLASAWREHVPTLCVIENGIDLSAFARASRDRRGEHAIWSGRIVPEKGLHLAIDAARAAGSRLAFAGPRGDAAYWDGAIAPRLGADLLDLGHLAHDELAVQLASARVALVTPCWDEPFGLVVAEALACGTPVAGFRRGALPHLLDASTGRLARPGDVPGLARAINEAAALDPEACRRRAVALFDAELMIDRYETLYADLVAARPCSVDTVMRPDLDAAEA